MNIKNMKYIKVENFAQEQQVKIVTLNRPEVRNAFHPAMIAEISEFFSGEKKSRLIILKAEGKVFCAGADLNWMKDMANYSFAENIADSVKLWNMFEAIQHCPPPVVAVAHGAVFGGGLGLLAASDYVFAEKNTKFCFSEVKLGLAPAVIAGFISRKIQDAFYRPLMLSAELFKSQHAKNIGLVHALYHTNIEISEIVDSFSENGIEAMRETKKLLNSLHHTQTALAHKNLCTRIISERRLSPEAQQRMKKYL